MKRLFQHWSFVVVVAALSGSLLLLIHSGRSSASGLNAQDANSQNRASKSDDGLWRFLDQAELGALAEKQTERLIVPTVYKTARLNHTSLLSLLSKAPMEFTEAAKTASVVMTLPMPDGTFARFYVQESPVMSPGLAAQVPKFKTYSGQGIDDPTATVRFDWLPTGFHAMVQSAGDTVFIDPYSKGETETYISYYRRDLQRGEAKKIRCAWRPSSRPSGSDALLQVQSTGDTLRVLRLAVAATAEYTEFYGGTKEGALAGIVTTMNRVNGIYERDLALRLKLIDRELDIIYTDPENQPYTNSDPSMMADENQANLDKVIGDANYDMGHVFGTEGGGVGGAGPCLTGMKAIGATGIEQPRGDAFDVSFVAHEMIHQFDGGHTFNALINDGMNECNEQNRDPKAAYEPGSGSTIASYAGICGCADLQPESDDYFNGNSIDQFLNYFTNIAQYGGSDCSVKMATGNRPPSVTVRPTMTIPANTPFTLTATGSDPDGNPLTYTWEQYDLGAPSSCLPDRDDGSRPIFRSFRPTTSPSRTFPRTNPPQSGEALPTTNRRMNFRCTVRDGRGGVVKATTQVQVTTTGSAFALTQFRKSGSWVRNSTQTVTWDVAKTDQVPINCRTVRVLLSTDGGQTFPIVLTESVPNTGSARVIIPADIPPTNHARIKVEAVGNVFFAVSQSDITINP